MVADSPSEGPGRKKTAASRSKSTGSGTGAKKPAPRKTAASKSTAKKDTTKKSTPAKSAAAKTTSRKSPAKKPVPEAESQHAQATRESVQQPAEPEAADEQQEEPMTQTMPETTADTERTPLPPEPTGDAVAAEPVETSVAPEVNSMMANRMIAFHLGGQRYAVPIDVVQEIQQIVAFSEIPAAGGAVVGMVNLRGSVIPAIDMRFLIGLAPEEYTLETPMVICRAHGQLVALIVDEVEDVLTMPEGCLQDAPAMHSLSSKMLGVCRLDTDLVYLLDVESLVAPVELPRR